MNISRVRSEEISEVIEIFKEIYPDRPVFHTREYFNWQFRDSPYNDTNAYDLWVSRSGGSLSAFVGLIPLRLKERNKTVPGISVQYLYGKKDNPLNLRLLLSDIVKCKYKLVLAANRTTESLLDPLGKSKQKPMPRWIACFDAKKTINIFGVKNIYNRQLLTESKAFFDSCNQLPRTIKKVKRFEESAEFVFEDKILGIKKYQRRDGRYLNWRYIDIPGHNYHAIQGQENDFLVYRIEKINNSKYGFIRILEMCGSEDWFRRSLTYLVRTYNHINVIGMDFFCSSIEFGNRLTKHGFFDSGRVIEEEIPYLFSPVFPGEGFCSYILQYNSKIDFDFSEWLITKGDSDIDRVRI